MNAPSFSTFSAISELFVTAGVLFIVYQNWKRNGFNWKLVTGLILFEFSVNMLYMIHRMNQASAVTADGSREFTTLTAFMAAHGMLSLVGFFLLVVLSALAFVDMKKGKFFFRDNPKVTFAFIALWMVSVISGEFLYFYNYYWS